MQRPWPAVLSHRTHPHKTPAGGFRLAGSARTGPDRPGPARSRPGCRRPCQRSRDGRRRRGGRGEGVIGPSRGRPGLARPIRSDRSLGPGRWEPAGAGGDSGRRAYPWPWTGSARSRPSVGPARSLVHRSLLLPVRLAMPRRTGPYSFPGHRAVSERGPGRAPESPESETRIRAAGPCGPGGA